MGAFTNRPSVEAKAMVSKETRVFSSKTFGDKENRFCSTSTTTTSMKPYFNVTVQNFGV